MDADIRIDVSITKKKEDLIEDLIFDRFLNTDVFDFQLKECTTGSPCRIECDMQIAIAKDNDVPYSCEIFNAIAAKGARTAARTDHNSTSGPRPCTQRHADRIEGGSVFTQ